MKKGLLLTSAVLSAMGLAHVYAKSKAPDTNTLHTQLQQRLQELPDSLLIDVKMEHLLDDEVYVKLAHDGWYQEEISTIMRSALRDKKEAKTHAGYAPYAKQWMPAFGRQPGGDTLYSLIDTTYSEEVRKRVAAVVPADLLNHTWPLEIYSPELRKQERKPGYFRHVQHCPSSGRTHWAAIHPDDANKIYAVPDGAGIFRTDDGGDHWRCITDNIPVRAHRSNSPGYAIPVDPDDFEHVFAFMNGNVVYESFNGGETWEQVAGATHHGFKRGYAYRDAQGNLTFIGCKSSYLEVSFDKGVTWNRVDIPNELRDQVNGARKVWVQQVAFDPFNRDMVYIPLGRSILYFDDGGRSLSLKKLSVEVHGETLDSPLRLPADYPDDATLFPLPATQQGFLEVSPLEPGKMWYSCSTGAGGIKSAIYRSEDYGHTWITMHEPCSGFGSGFVYGDDLPNGWLGGFGVNFTDDNYMYGTSMASGWTDNGRNFTKSSWGWRSFAKYLPDGKYYNVSNSRHTCDNHFIISHKSGRLFRGSDGGFFTVDKDMEIPGRAKNLWYNIGGDMGQMLYYHVAVNEFGDQAMIGNTQDLDAQTWRYGRWGNWRGYEGSEAFFNPFSGVAYFSGGGGGGGQDGSFGLSSWFCRVAKADVVTGSWFMTKRLPQSSSVPFFRIDDIGRTAIPLNSGHMANGVRNMNDVVLCRDKDTTTIYVIANDGVIMRSTDAGKSFHSVMYGANEAKFSTARLAGDPNNSDILYLGIKGKVMKYFVNESRTEDLTQNGLPDIDCNQLIFHEGSGDIYFINHNTAGIYLLENGSGEWRYWLKGYNSGKLGNVSLNYTTQEMVFSDYGRGVWVADLEHPADRYFANGFALRERSNIDGMRTIGIDSEWIIPLYHTYKWTVNGQEVECPYQYLTAPLKAGDKVQLELGLRECNDVNTLSAEFTVPESAPVAFDHSAGLALYSNGEGRIDLGYNDYFYGDFTIDLWVRPMGNGTILANSQLGSRGDAKGWVLYLDNGTLKFLYSPRNRFSQPTYEPAETQEVTVAGGSLKIGQWSHVAVTMQRNGTVTLYVNGNQTAQGSRIIPESDVNCMNLSLFADLIEQNCLEGYADEIKVWRRALTLPELRAEMYSSNGQDAEGLVAYYNFNGGTLGTDREAFSGKSAVNRVRAVTKHSEQTLPLGANRAVYDVMNDTSKLFESQGEPLLRISSSEASGAGVAVYAYESAQWQHDADNLDATYYDRRPRGYLIHAFGNGLNDKQLSVNFYPQDGTSFDPHRTYRLYVDDPAEHRLFWHEHEWSTLTFDPETNTLKAEGIPGEALLDKKLLVVALKPAIELTVEGLNEHNELEIYSENKTTRTLTARTIEGMDEPTGTYALTSDSLIVKTSPLSFQKGVAKSTLSVDLSQLGAFNTPTATYLRGADAKMIPMRVDVINRITPRELGSAVALNGGGMAIGSAQNFNRLNNCNTVTMMTWVKFDTLATTGTFPVMMVGSYNSNGIGFVIENGKFRIKWNGSAASFNHNFSEAQEGQWMHLAMVVTPTITYTYVNGACLQSNFTFGGFNASAPLLLGMKDVNDKNFRGAFDQAAVWSRALSQDEIIKYMHRSVPMDQPGLVAYVNMDDRTPDGNLRESFALMDVRTYGSVEQNAASTVPYDAIDTDAAINIEGTTRSVEISTFKGQPYNFYNTEYADEVPLNNEFYAVAYTTPGTAAEGEMLTLNYRHPSIVAGDTISLMIRPLGTVHEFTRHITAEATAEGATFRVPYAAIDSAAEVMFLTKNIGTMRPISLSMDFAGGYGKGERHMLTPNDMRIPVSVKVKAGDAGANVRLNLRESEYARFDHEEIDMTHAESRHYIVIDPEKINRHGINTLTVNVVGAATEEMKLEFYLEPEVRLTLANGRDANTFVATKAVTTLDIRAELVDGYLDGDVDIETTADISSSMNIGTGTLLLDQNVTYGNLQHHEGTMGDMHEGWNFIGNPYLSNVNLTKHQNVEFEQDEVTKFVYHVNSATGNFMAYDMTSYNDEHTITPFGAFFVQVRGANACFTITPTAKDSKLNKRNFDFYDLDEEQTVQLHLLGADGTEHDRTEVQWLSDADADFVTNEDAHKLWSLNDNANQLYTMAGTTAAAISAVDTDSKDVSLGLKLSSTGTYAIAPGYISGFDGDRKLYLVDDVTGDEHLLEADGEPYVFTAASLDGLDNRFTLHVDENGSVGIDNTFATSGYKVYTSKGAATVTGLQGNAVISVYAPSGQMLARENSDNSQHTIALETGVYMIKIHENGKNYAKKIAIQ